MPICMLVQWFTEYGILEQMMKKLNHREHSGSTVCKAAVSLPHGS